MKISRETLARMPELIEAYRSAGYGGPGAVKDPTYGACLNCSGPFMSRLENDDYCAIWLMLKRLPHKWPKFSGCGCFPVPAPTGEYPGLTGGEAAREMYENTLDVWAGEYGDLRREFCRYMANAIDEYCNGRLDDAEDTEH